jgi:RNA polymerase sigma-70 factor, ECF subfamily
MRMQGPAVAEGALVDRIRSGDPEAWRALAEAYRQPLRDLAAAAVPPRMTCRDDASDIVQQTMVEANLSFDDFHGGSMPELYAWLAAILNHNVSDAVRRHVAAKRRSINAEQRPNDSGDEAFASQAALAADHTSPSMAASRTERYARLREAIERLPPRQRLAVQLRHLEGRSLVEIAERLDANVQATAQLIARGLRALRVSLVRLD